MPVSALKSILIVDDHDSLRFLLANVLSKHYNVIAKNNAIDATAWLRYGNLPDAILLDLNLPRLTGLEFLNNLKSSGIYSKIPVIILSADIDNATKKSCYDLGINDFIQKPFDPIKLKEKIHKTLNPVSQAIHV